VESQITTGDSFYTRILAEEDKAAAYAALLKWNIDGRRRDIAEGIKPVAQGLLALARVDVQEDYITVTDTSEHAPYPRNHYATTVARKVTFLNRQAPGCGCSQPRDAAIFAPYGQLGLRAVTLEVGMSSLDEHWYGRLGLVLPVRSIEIPTTREFGFTVATMDLTGFTNGHMFSPNLDQDGYLRYALGLIDLDEAIGSIRSSGGHFDNAIGFPGATNFLADALPKLGQYLTDLAAKLAPDHSH
jgi:hypothetical protein